MKPLACTHLSWEPVGDSSLNPVSSLLCFKLSSLALLCGWALLWPESSRGGTRGILVDALNSMYLAVSDVLGMNLGVRAQLIN